jgi:ABC-type spermidine/putrescine transport system permease subunit II
VTPGTRRFRLPFSPWHLLMAPLALVFAVPLVWLVLSSVMSNAEINRFPPALWPSGVDLSGFRYVLGDAKFPQWFANSLIVSAAAVVSNLVFGVLGGYAFARMRFGGSRLLLVLMLATMVIPFQLTMIPTFIVMKWLGLIDTLGVDRPVTGDAVRRVPHAAVLPVAAQGIGGGRLDRRVLDAAGAGPDRAAVVAPRTEHGRGSHVSVHLERSDVAADRDQP